MPHMYGMHKDGFLELELADWKHTRALVLPITLLAKIPDFNFLFVCP